MKWSSQGSAVVAPVLLTDGRSGNAVVVGPRSKPKGVVVIVKGADSGEPETLTLSDCLDALKPTDAIGDPFPFSTSGVAIERNIADDGSVGIVMVYEGSPASRAGLAAGDRIMSLNSISVRDLGVKGVRDQMRQAPGTKITLQVRQAGSVRDVELELDALL